MGDLKLPSVADGSAPVWHLYVVRTAEPERLAAFLQERGIATGRHYPDPVHLSPAYAWLGHRQGDFPVAEALAREVSLPSDLPRHHGRAARRRHRGRSRLLRWLTRPRTTRRTGSSTPSRSGKTCGSDPSRTSTDARSEPAAHRPVCRDPAGVTIGERCKIQSHTFICDGVEIDDEVFVGHGVLFINDKRPRSTTDEGELQIVGGLGAGTHICRAWGLDRIGSRHHGRSPNRRRGAHRGRGRGDA